MSTLEFFIYLLALTGMVMMAKIEYKGPKK